MQGDTQIVDESRQTVCDADRRRCDEVVATGMTQAGQCVVLSTDRQV